jgi:hypothetical protein
MWFCEDPKKDGGQTLLFGTHSNCLDLRCHKPRSKTKRLLNVFGDVAKAARIYPYAGFGGHIVRQIISLNNCDYYHKTRAESQSTTKYTPLYRIFGENERTMEPKIH